MFFRGLCWLTEEAKFDYLKVNTRRVYVEGSQCFFKSWRFTTETDSSIVYNSCYGFVFVYHWLNSHALYTTYIDLHDKVQAFSRTARHESLPFIRGKTSLANGCSCLI